MLCVGVRYVKTKDGRDMGIVNYIGRRVSDGTYYSDKAWISGAELTRHPISCGDQFNLFKDGSILPYEGSKISMDFLGELV